MGSRGVQRQRGRRTRALLHALAYVLKREKLVGEVETCHGEGASHGVTVIEYAGEVFALSDFVHFS